MPSEHQSGRRTDYPSEEYRFLATKNDATLKAIVRGIRKAERARAYVQAEVALAKSEGRKPRKELIGMLNQKIDALQTDATDGG